jgi:hypothetical protein
MKFLNVFLLSLVFFSCRKIERITYKIDMISEQQLMLSIFNNSDKDYYFAFKEINQPKNPGPSYIGLKVLSMNEDENLDSLREIAYANYISASEKHGMVTHFSYTQNEIKEYSKQKYFFIKSHFRLEILLEANSNKELFSKYPFELQNYEFRSTRKNVADDFYAKGSIGNYMPYIKKIEKSEE